jgi:hypothetical protein
MADPDALRSRRKRLHAAGDHSLCRRCGAVRAVLPVPAAPGTPEGRVDAQASLEALARRLEGAHEASPGDAQVARVLKDVLLALRGPAGEGADDELAKFDAEFSRA